MKTDKDPLNPQTPDRGADLDQTLDRVRKMIEKTALWKHTERYGRLRGELVDFLVRRVDDIISHWFQDEGIESFEELQKEMDIGLQGVGRVDESETVAETLAGLRSFIRHIGDPSNTEIYAILRKDLREGIMGRISPTLVIIDILNMKDVTYRFLEEEFAHDPERRQNLKDLFSYHVAELLCHLVEFVIEVREDAIRETEEIYREGINNANAGIVLFDPQTGLIRDVNILAGAYVGRTKEELLGRPWWDLFCPTQRTQVESFGERLLRQGSAEESHMCIHNTAGELKPVMSSANLIRYRGEELVQLIVVDITERVRLEEEAAYFRELAEGIVQSITSGVIVRDCEQKVIYVNDKHLEITGLAREEVLGKTPLEIVEKMDFESEGASREDLIRELHETMGQVAKGACTPWREVAIRNRETGRSRIIRFCHGPLQGGGDEPPERYISIMEDITESRQLQLQLLQSEKMASIGQLAAGIAHEIRNPLAIISNALYDLDQICDKDDKDVQEDIAIAREEMSRVQDIINNLLEFSRDSGSGSEMIDLASLIDKTLKLLTKDLQKREVNVVRSFEEGVKLFVNLNGLRQILLNLVTNAAQAMPDGGTLTVAVRRSAGGFIEIEVRDTGVGIPPEILPDIFNPFFTTKPPGQGTGLGLSIVHSVVERMGGRIRVESEPGRGTSFIVELPAEAGG